MGWDGFVRGGSGGFLRVMLEYLSVRSIYFKSLELNHIIARHVMM